LADFFTLADDSAVAILPHALRIAAELGIAERLAERALSVKELAVAVDCHPDALNRLMRALASVGLFRQVEAGRYELTDVGQRLRPGAPDTVHATIVNPDSQRAWLSATHTLRTGEPVFGTGRPGGEESGSGARRDAPVGDGQGSDARGEFFGHMDRDPRTNRAFLQRMRERAARLYPFLVSAVDWSASRVVMDIGGGDGYLLDRVLLAAPHVRGVLFDRPAAIEIASTGEAGDSADDLAARRTLCAGDFFAAIPGGSDTHLMCSVLHDWSDEQAAVILSNSRRALAAGGRLLIVEMVVPEDDGWHPSKWSDLGMMVLTGGRERTAAEFATLLELSGYALRSIQPVPESSFQLLTAAPVAGFDS
jgi:hypothetical protein